MRSRATEVMLELGLYENARRAYQTFFNRAYRRELGQLRRLFATFVTPGSIVFDVGANKGEFTSVFMGLGATVVAVEPNPALADRLRRRFRRAVVVEAAVGATEGTAALHLGADTNYSTVSERWRAVAEERNRLSGAVVQVPVTTLDALIAKYGHPAFVKLDIEGNELAALSGLGTPVQGLCFEFQCPLLDELRASLNVLETLGPYRFGTPRDGAVDCTDDSGAAMAAIESDCRRGVGSGDIFARLTSC